MDSVDQTRHSTMNIPQQFVEDLKDLDKRDKTRKTRYMHGKMSGAAYVGGIVRDLEKYASEGKLGKYVFCLKMYEDTLVETKGHRFVQYMTDRAKPALIRFKEDNNTNQPF